MAIKIATKAGSKKTSKSIASAPVERPSKIDISKLDPNSVEAKLRALYELQRIDTQIDKIRIVRGELPMEVDDL